MKRNVRIFFILLAIFLIAGAAYFYFVGGQGRFPFSFFSTDNDELESNDTPRIVRAKKGNLVQKILETGVINTPSQINIKSKLGGKITHIDVEEGDHVKEGENLIHLDSSDVQSRKNQANANLERSQAEIDQALIRLEYTRANLQSSEKLFSKGLIAQYELEQARRDYNLAKTQLNASYSNKQYYQEVYSSSLSEMKNTIIKAPMSGVIIKRLVEEGEIVAPISQVLLIMADLSRLGIKTEINEIDINKVKVGQLAEIKFDAIVNRFYHGRVSKIGPVGKKTGNIVSYGVEIKILNPDDHVKPDMSCDVDLIIEKVENIIYLPIEVIAKKGGENFVLMKRGENFSWVEVTLGIANDSNVVIEKGVKEGEEVKFLSYLNGREKREAQPKKRQGKDFK